MFKRAEHIFVDIAKQYVEYNDIKDRIRGLHSFGELSDKEYDFIIENWDNLLEKHNL